jgi:hypothetical protein
MYSELLAMSLSVDADTAPDGPPSEERLVELLLAYRDRLGVGCDSPSSAPSDTPSRIAAEIRYDRTLVELCQLHAIPWDIRRFACPACERRRLEEELEGAGVDVGGARTAQPRTADLGQDPPAGS